MSRFTNSFSQEVWFQKYKYGEDTCVEDTWRRVAKDIASVEKEENREEWEKWFYQALEDFKFVPGGRITSNAGTGLKGTTYINCFCCGFIGEDQDSLEGIYSALTRQAKILKSEGGYGFCANVMRPRGAHIKGIANQSPGAIKFLELWDKSSEIITAGSGKKTGRKDQKNFIRKGAQMVTMSCWHPDIIEFIEAKKTDGCLTKFNMSVLCTDEFMKAVETNQRWDLIFPNYEAYPELYKKYWDGNINKWLEIVTKEGYTKDKAIVVYHSFDSAKELWDLIMKNTYNRNEPGVLFVDTFNRMNNLWYNEYIQQTNPCIAQGSLVNTPNGYRKVEDIKKGEMVSTVLGSEPVSTIETHKNYPTFKVVFSDGNEQIVTAAHKYHATRKGSGSKKVELLRLDELNVGDSVRVYRSFMEDEDYYPNYDKGIQAGILLGDGCYTEKQLKKKVIKIASSKDDIDLNENIKEYVFQDYTFNKDDLSKDSKSMNLVLKMSKKDIKDLGLTPQYSHEKTISYDKINSLGFAVGLLDGLLATDGNVNLKSNHPQIRWDTTSKELAKTIRNTLLYLGCHGFISENNSKGGVINGRQIERNHTKYTVTISGESIRSYISHTKLNEIHPQKYEKLIDAQKNFRLTGNRWSATIKSIEEYGKTNVYDLYCKESDTWITEGYVQQGCGEQILPIGGVCLLGSINLVHFIDPVNKTWDWKKLGKYIDIAVRFMDNVNDITNVPLESQKVNLRDKRRIGLGIFGYGSALMMAKIKYGSKKALEITEELMDFFTNRAYQASAKLAEEKGSFLLYSQEEYLAGEFIKNLSTQTTNLIKKHGMRNSHVTSIQPTGNSSCFANIVTGGLEPMFNHGYYRTSIQPYSPEGLDVPRHVDFSAKTYEGENWEWVKEGDENLLAIEFEGKVWKFDSHRGLTKEEWVEDYGVSYLKREKLWNESAKWASTAQDLDVDAHINTMAIFAKWVDSAISKTINLPKDYSYDDFKEVYNKAWKNGIKGFTTYRAGTMTSVISTTSSVSKKERPRELKCDVHHITVKGESYFVLVGLQDNDPYEVFAGKNGFIDKKVKEGSIIKLKRPKGVYKAILEDGLELSPINQTCSADEDALTRTTSLSLRCGADMHEIVQQLEKVRGDMTSFAKSMSRALKKYIPDGTKEDGFCPECEKTDCLIRQEGCLICKSCGYSACV